MAPEGDEVPILVCICEGRITRVTAGGDERAWLPDLAQEVVALQ